MKIKPFLGLLCPFVLTLTTACSNQNTATPGNSDTSFAKQHAIITIKNPTAIKRVNAPVYIPFTDLGVEAETLEDFRLVSGSEAVAFESIDRDGDGQKEGVFTLVNIEPNQILNLQLLACDDGSQVQTEKLTQAEIAIKEGGKWGPHPNAEGKQAYQGGSFTNVESVTLPEFYTDHSNWIRYEGPGIESNKVAYRIYLDHRNGFDIFGKTQSEPVLQNIGQDGYQSYHSMQDWGMDILKVGASLGAGGFGFWNGDSVTPVSDTQSRGARIVENGDLYSLFAIDYGQWLVDGERRDVSALFSMHGGSRLVNTHIEMDKPLSNLAIGIVKHAGTEFLQGKTGGNSEYSYIGSWGRQSESGDHLGMAVIFKTNQFQQTVDGGHSYVALMHPKDMAGKSTLEYYFVAAWEGEHGNGIGSKNAFVAYLQDEINKLSLPLVIELTRQVNN